MFRAHSCGCVGEERQSGDGKENSVRILNLEEIRGRIDDAALIRRMREALDGAGSRRMLDSHADASRYSRGRGTREGELPARQKIFRAEDGGDGEWDDAPLVRENRRARRLPRGSGAFDRCSDSGGSGDGRSRIGSPRYLDRNFGDGDSGPPDRSVSSAGAAAEEDLFVGPRPGEGRGLRAGHRRDGDEVARRGRRFHAN